MNKSPRFVFLRPLRKVPPCLRKGTESMDVWVFECEVL